MLLFLCILLIIIALVILSEIKLIVKNYQYTNKQELKKEGEYEIKLGLYFLGKIKWLGVTVKNNKVNNNVKNKFKEKIVKINQRNQRLTKNQKKNQNVLIRKILFEIKEKFILKKLDLYILLDTKDIVLTSYLIGITSTIIPNIIRKNIEKFNNEKYKLKILPLYKNTNTIYIKLNCILSIKIVHIINMFTKIKFRKGKYTNIN